MSIRHIVGAACLVGLVAGCGRPISSEPKVNIDLPIEDDSIADVRAAIRNVKAYEKEGTFQIPLAQLFEDMMLPDEIKPYVDRIVAERAAFLDVECRSGRCSATSQGQAQQIKIDIVKIPVLGSPDLSLAETIVFELRFLSDQAIEVCSVQGVKVKKSLLRVNLDGLRVILTDQGVQEALIDAGLGGDYPTKDCGFAGKS